MSPTEVPRPGPGDRVGLRLSGPRLERARGDEAPVLFLADHPVTGSHPVPAVVATADLPAVAQLRPGAEVCFRPA